jgi:hypothetical protein
MHGRHGPDFRIGTGDDDDLVLSGSIYGDIGRAGILARQTFDPGNVNSLGGEALANPLPCITRADCPDHPRFGAHPRGCDRLVDAFAAGKPGCCLVRARTRFVVDSAKSADGTSA